MKYKSFIVGVAVDRVASYDITVRARTADEAKRIAQKQLDHNGVEAFGFVDETTLGMRIDYAEELR